MQTIRYIWPLLRIKNIVTFCSTLIESANKAERRSPRSRMWWQIWLVWILGILGLTTMPWENYVGHSHWDLVNWIPFNDHRFAVEDLLANIALFVPFGFFLGHASRGASGKKVWSLAFLASAMLSTSVEFFQVYCHNRNPSTTDICNNVLGAALGVWLSIPH
jgi:glycopeptide antibiotics resistance protein